MYLILFDRYFKDYYLPLDENDDHIKLNCIKIV